MLQFIFILAHSFNFAQAMPPELIDIHKYAPTILVDMKYLGTENFLGRKVAGYFSNKCYLSEAAARALAGVQTDLQKIGYSVKVHDCSRPQRAVDDFVAWGSDLKDQKMKKQFYPEVEKSKLFELGYISSKSGHSRGSTVDLTIVKRNSKKFIDVEMGSPYDFFGEISHTENKNVKPEHLKNRYILLNAMAAHGFKNYDKEWWHFTLNNEPYPNTYFDFEIK